MWIRVILLEVIRGTIVNHGPLGRRVLNWGRRVGILNSVQHRIEKMRSNHDVARSDFRHGLLWRIFAFNLISLGLLRFSPIPYENAIAEPFLFRPF
jgi:hypothetical protein